MRSKFRLRLIICMPISSLWFACSWGFYQASGFSIFSKPEQIHKRWRLDLVFLQTSLVLLNLHSVCIFWNGGIPGSHISNPHINPQIYMTVTKLSRCISGWQATWTRQFGRISSFSLKQECGAMKRTHEYATLGQPCSQTWVLLESPLFYSNEWRDFLSLSSRGAKSNKNLRNYMFSAGWRYFSQLLNEEMQNRETFRLEWFFFNRMHGKSHKFYILMPHHPEINNSKQNPQGRN